MMYLNFAEVPAGLLPKWHGDCQLPMGEPARAITRFQSQHKADDAEGGPGKGSYPEILPCISAPELWHESKNDA